MATENINEKDDFYQKKNIIPKEKVPAAYALASIKAPPFQTVPPKLLGEVLPSPTSPCGPGSEP